MAFKAITMESKTSFISHFDPAIDHEKSDFTEFSKVMFKNPGAWRDYVKAKPGETLCVFHIGVVPPDVLTCIEDDCKLSFHDQVMKRQDSRGTEAKWRCFLSGLRDIEGWHEDVPKVTVHGVSYVDPVWIKKTFIRGLRRIAIDVGSIIWMFNQLTEDDIKN